MSQATLAFSERDFASIQASLQDARESAAILLVGESETREGLLLTCNTVYLVPDHSYETRTPRELEIKSEGWMQALRLAAEGNWLPVFMHTHPGMSARPSLRDDRVDSLLAESFTNRIGCKRYVSVIFGGSADRVSFTGRIYMRNGRPDPLERLRVVGQRLRVQLAEDTSSMPTDRAIFDRQILAFGAAGQRLLKGLRVGVVGSGGTGSAVQEQLVRLGFGSVTSIDYDVVTETNVTRIYGSTLADVCRPKVEVVAEHLAGIGLGTELHPVRGSVVERKVMEELRGCDVVFGCTDDDAGRGVLSRLAYWYLLPVIDMGVRISSRDGEISGVHGRITVATPGERCLLCRDEFDPNVAREQSYSPEERSALQAEGYAQGLAERDPAVIAYTTLVASSAVANLLQRLFGFGSQLPGKQLLQISDWGIRHQGAQARDGCYCLTPDKWGRGDCRSPLGLTWAA